MIRSIILFSFLFFHNLSASQKSSEQITHEVYNNIIEAIGFTFPPNLEFTDSKNKVAYYNGNEIIIEKKLIQELFKEKNFEDKISYIISHELAHAYFNHTWMHNSGLGYSGAGELVNEMSYSREQRKLSETQADLFSGFFGQRAGYNTLGNASETLRFVYDLYKIPNEISGYPSFDERIEIIKSRKDLSEKLVLIFDLANIFLRLKEYEIASMLYDDIIRNEFKSREVYNNLGLSYLLRSVVNNNKLNKYKYPIHIDLESRAKTDVSRSSTNSFKNVENNIANAKKYFDLSIKLDKNYKPAVQNLFVLKFLYDQNRDLILDKIKESKTLMEETKIDFEVINMLFNGNRAKKIKKVAKKGSQISYDNLNESILTINKSDPAFNYLVNKLNINPSLFFGFASLNNPIRINTPKGKIRINYSINTDYTIYKISFQSDDIFLIKTNKEIDNKYNYPSLKFDDFIYFLNP